MRSSVDQPKLNRRPNEHVWHALWHALGDIAGKTGPKFFAKEGMVQFG
jgi:hypothetical protein